MYCVTSYEKRVGMLTEGSWREAAVGSGSGPARAHQRGRSLAVCLAGPPANSLALPSRNPNLVDRSGGGAVSQSSNHESSLDAVFKPLGEMPILFVTFF